MGRWHSILGRTESSVSTTLEAEPLFIDKRSPRACGLRSILNCSRESGLCSQSVPYPIHMFALQRG